MKRPVFILAAILFFSIIPITIAQEMTVTDSDDNMLLQVNDEGDAGSVTLPQNTAPPADTTDKLYNVNGVLFWNDAQLGTGWTRTGTDVHLTNNGDNVGIGVTDPDAKLEVNGQVKITGGAPGADRVLTSDADGLATWETNHQPRAAFAGGDLSYQVTSNYGSFGNPKNVTITVPGGGTILTSATGYASWESANWDLFLIGILADYEGDPNSSWTAENTWYSYLMIATDYNCTDATDQFTSWSVQRGFTVSGAGTYTFGLWCNKYSSAAATELGDINLFAEYFPN